MLSSGILAAVRGSVQAAAKDQPLRYARVAADGAQILNLADDKGKEVARPARGQLVAVYKENAGGWLEVEVPGGFAVWVFGRYLAPTNEPNLYEVTGNAVNLRPAPSNDVTNFPLPQRLQAGDRVRGIELAEPERPLAETWVRVWSPPRVRGCVRASLLEDVPVAAPGASESGPLLWAAALKALPVEAPPARSVANRPVEPSATERKDAEARAALEQARAELEHQRQSSTPDYGAVESALNAVVARGGAVAIEARAELRTVAHLREAAALKADLEHERQRRAEEAIQAQQSVWDKSRDKDPLGLAFAARGVVERRTGSDGIARFYLNFGGQTTCEIACSSGRYDLSTFAGTEIGVHGSEVTSRTGELPTFELARLEVIAVR